MALAVDAAVRAAWAWASDSSASRLSWATSASTALRYDSWADASARTFWSSLSALSVSEVTWSASTTRVAKSSALVAPSATDICEPPPPPWKRSAAKLSRIDWVWSSLAALAA